MTDWLTPDEVAAATARHVVTVRAALRSGELHGHQRARRGPWTVNRDSVEAWRRGMNGTAACGCARLKLARRSA